MRTPGLLGRHSCEGLASEVAVHGGMRESLADELALQLEVMMTRRQSSIEKQLKSNMVVVNNLAHSWSSLRAAKMTNRRCAGRLAKITSRQLSWELRLGGKIG